MKNELFVPYRQSLDLRELGFEEPCLGNYKKTGGLHILHYGTCGSTKNDAFNTLAPLYSQAFRWFREKYGLLSRISYKSSTYKFEYQYKSSANNLYMTEYDTYEEAELECLKKLIEIVKYKNEQNR